MRHNLSMNPHFRKGTKSKNGAGHVWVLAQTEGEGSTGVSELQCHVIMIMEIMTCHNYITGRVSASQADQHPVRGR